MAFAEIMRGKTGTWYLRISVNRVEVLLLAFDRYIEAENTAHALQVWVDKVTFSA